MLNNDFYRFLVGFVAIVAVAFGVLVVTNQTKTENVDTGYVAG